MKLKEKKKKKKKEKRGCKCKWSGGNLELHAGIGQPAGRVSQWPRSGSSARNAQRGSGGLGWKPPGERRVLGRAWGGGDLCRQLPLQGGHSAGGRRDTRAFQLPTHCGRGDSPAAGPRPAAPADPGGRQDRSGRGLVGGSLLWRQRAWGEETRCLGPGWNSRQLRSLGNLNLPRWGRPQLNMLQGWD